jgi:hypothetical protein
VTTSDLPPHTYEEVREAIMDVLMNRVSVGGVPDSFDMLIPKVAAVFALRSAQPAGTVNPNASPNLHPSDAELAREVFWDLFRQGLITLGKDSQWNTGWPCFRLSRFGAKALKNQSPYRFHDITSYLTIVKQEVPDILDCAVIYLEEAVAAFYADCLLASCMMLGVAAEAEFLRLVDVATKSTTHAATFASIAKQTVIRPKITKFHTALKPLIPTLQPKKDFEDLDSNLTLIQSVLRIARNDAGHPTATTIPEREQVYVYLQLFVPFARQVMRLRNESWLRIFERGDKWNLGLTAGMVLPANQERR